MKPHRYSYRNPSANPTAITITDTDGATFHVYRARSGVLVVSPHPETPDFPTSAHLAVWSWRKWAKKIIKRIREGDPAPVIVDNGN